MITLLADVNIQGHVDRMAARMQAELWREIWEHLEVRYIQFQDVGLDPADTDAAVWRKCQEQGIFLLTNNRNDDGPDSLEATIRISNTSQSLPVFTIGDADGLLIGTDYADRAIDRLFRYLLDMDNILGTGRLYLP